MGEKEIERFLSHLATHEKIAASTQRQALNALVFLYRDVLLKPLDNSIEHAYSLRITFEFTCILKRSGKILGATI